MHAASSPANPRKDLIAGLLHTASTCAVLHAGRSSTAPGASALSPGMPLFLHWLPVLTKLQPIHSTLWRYRAQSGVQTGLNQVKLTSIVCRSPASWPLPLDVVRRIVLLPCTQKRRYSQPAKFAVAGERPTGLTALLRRRYSLTSDQPCSTGLADAGAALKCSPGNSRGLRVRRSSWRQGSFRNFRRGPIPGCPEMPLLPRRRPQRSARTTLPYSAIGQRNLGRATGTLGLVPGQTVCQHIGRLDGISGTAESSAFSTWRLTCRMPGAFPRPCQIHGLRSAEARWMPFCLDWLFTNTTICLQPRAESQRCLVNAGAESQLASSLWPMLRLGLLRRLTLTHTTVQSGGVRTRLWHDCLHTDKAVGLPSVLTVATPSGAAVGQRLLARSFDPNFKARWAGLAT